MPKEEEAQELTGANKLTRLVRAKQLLRMYPQNQVHFSWFTDEKVFTVASPINPQNDRLYVVRNQKEDNICRQTAAHQNNFFQVGDGVCWRILLGVHRTDVRRTGGED